jgi:hypothetical protein
MSHAAMKTPMIEEARVPKLSFRNPAPPQIPPTTTAFARRRRNDGAAVIVLADRLDEGPAAVTVSAVPSDISAPALSPFGCAALVPPC